MASNETKVKSFRVSEEVTEHIQRLMQERQLTTNQLFEEFIQLADKQSPDPLIDEENNVLETTLNQITSLFHERALRLEKQQKETQRMTIQYTETIRELEDSIVKESEDLHREYEAKVMQHQEELEQLQQQLDQLHTDKQNLLNALETEKQSAKEELKVHKKTIFDLEGSIRKLEESQKQLNRQNQSLMDAVDELKSKTRRSEQLEEENQKLHLEVQLLRREKEAFEHRLQEQVELAVLRERNLQQNNS
ncbi:hypothetical protein OKS35_14340 [Exiguobacterium sp. N5]|uniref:hypothetical protein n=1 Tax=Exiguobacterium sp. N5 TaxID=2990450 RepID=UPI0021F488E5|nr:hypothetical protein [Exiguobacterium sp. N5]MCV9901304.1 hypothetical protein [Exiguobacterium sp. N5]